MALTFQEEIALRAAFMEIQRARKAALRQMFQGTQLKVKSYVADAKELKKEAAKAKKAVEKIPGIAAPDLDMPSLNLDLFKGIDLRNLLDIDVPSLGIPDWNINLIPDIRLGDIPGFSLPTVRINLKGLIKYKDLLPDISLRMLVLSIHLKFPHIQIPSLVIDLGKILDVDLPNLIPDLRVAFPDFFDIDVNVSLPNLGIPDVNLPNIIPDIDLPNIDLSALSIPGFDIPELLRIPGFDKVLRLLFELFDVVDLPDVIGELGVGFMTEFISSALPIIQQVKSGAKAARSWGKAAQDLHRSIKVRKHMPFILPGDARDACLAVRTLLRESSAEHATTATIETTQFTVSTVGLFADLGTATGPAVSAAAAFAKLCQKITIFAVKYKEMKKINRILASAPENTLTSNIFQVSPLLGCYYLANNDTSNCLNILVDNILEDDWMADWENNKRRHLDPLIKDSQKFIDKSRYVLDPIRQDKGMWVERSRMARMKEGFTLAIKKKLGRAPKSASVATHRNIGRR